MRHNVLDEPCWNCGNETFTSSATAHHLTKQVICSSCYEPQGEDDEYFEDEDYSYLY